jgi:hypothetical protein
MWKNKILMPMVLVLVLGLVICPVVPASAATYEHHNATGIGSAFIPDAGGLVRFSFTAQQVETTPSGNAKGNFSFTVLEPDPDLMIKAEVSYLWIFSDGEILLAGYITETNVTGLPIGAPVFLAAKAPNKISLPGYGFSLETIVANPHYYFHIKNLYDLSNGKIRYK